MSQPAVSNMNNLMMGSSIGRSRMFKPSAAMRIEDLVKLGRGIRIT